MLSQYKQKWTEFAIQNILYDVKMFGFEVTASDHMKLHNCFQSLTDSEFTILRMWHHETCNLTLYMYKLS